MRSPAPASGTTLLMKVAVLTTDNRDHYRDYQCARPYFGTAPQALLEGMAGLPELEVHVVACAQQPMAAPEKLADNIWFHHLHVPPLGWMRTGYQGCIRATRRKLREIQPDIVHGQGTERDCAISAVLGGFPNVLTIHGNMNAVARMQHSRIGSFYWLAARLENFTLPRAGGIICISEYVRELVAGAGRPSWLVPNAIRQSFFDIPRAGTPPRERPLLINIGVISDRKRQQPLLAMLAGLRAQGREFDTMFVGAADADSAYAQTFLTQLAEADRRHGGFQHTRSLDTAGICQLLDQAAAMIHFASEETFGLTFAEAIARGLYLFASDVGAIRPIARGVDDVQIYDLADWSGLAAGIGDWLQSGAWQKPRAAQPPPVFLQSFHPRHVAERHLEIYKSVLKSTP